MKVRTYGYDRVEMARNLSLEQLDALKQKVEEDHAQKDGIHLYDAAGRKKLDNISWAVFHKTNQHPCSGKCTEYKQEQCKNCLVGDV